MPMHFLPCASERRRWWSLVAALCVLAAAGCDPRVPRPRPLVRVVRCQRDSATPNAATQRLGSAVIVSDATNILGGHLHTCAAGPNHTLTCWGRRPWLRADPVSSGPRPGRGGAMFISAVDGALWNHHQLHTILAASAAGSNLYLLQDERPIWLFSYVGEDYSREAAALTNVDLASGAASACTVQDGTVDCERNGVSMARFASLDFERAVVVPGHLCFRQQNHWHCGSVSRSTLGLSPLALLSGADDVPVLTGSIERICGLTPQGVRCWSNEALGDAPTDFALADTTQLVAGADFVCALTTTGIVHCMGSDPFVTQARGWSFQPVLGLPAMSQLASGLRHVCGRTTTGEVWCWGDPTLERLGESSLDEAETTEVTLPGPAKAIAAGFRHSCAQLQDNRVYCWGLNFFGAASGRPSPLGFYAVIELQMRAQPVAQFNLTPPSPDAELATLDHATCLCGRSTCRCVGFAARFAAVNVGIFETGLELSRYHRSPRQSAFRYDELQASCLPPLLRPLGQAPLEGHCGRDDVDFAARLPGIVELACGDGHRCGRTGDGRVFCQGRNNYFQSAPIAASAMGAPRRVVLRDVARRSFESP